MTHNQDGQATRARARPDAARAARPEGERGTGEDVATLRSTLALPGGQAGLCVGERRTGEQRTFSTPLSPGITAPRLTPPPTCPGTALLGAAWPSDWSLTSAEHRPDASPHRSERPSALDGSSAAVPLHQAVPAAPGFRGLRRLSVCSTNVASIAIRGRIACPRRSAAPRCGAPVVRSSARPASSRPARRACGPGPRC